MEGANGACAPDEPHGFRGVGKQWLPAIVDSDAGGERLGLVSGRGVKVRNPHDNSPGLP